MEIEASVDRLEQEFLHLEAVRSAARGRQAQIVRELDRTAKRLSDLP